MPYSLQFRLRFALLLLLLVMVGRQTHAANADPELGVTFLGLRPGGEGKMALFWQGDSRAKVDVYIDFDGDQAWAADELVLEGAPIPANEVVLYTIRAPAKGAIDSETQVRLVVRGAARETLLDDERSLSEPKGGRQPGGPCGLQDFVSSPPTLAPGAAAIYNDGTGAALYVAVYDQVSRISYLAKWKGERWLLLDFTFGGEVRVLAAFTDPRNGNLNNLFAGGSFSRVGAAPAANIAVFDGKSWSESGSGLNAAVNTFESFQGRLYVGGEFTSTGEGAALKYFGQWNDNRWQAIGEGIDGPVTTLVGFQSADDRSLLLAGGSFFQVGSLETAGMAAWDIRSRTWETLSQGHELQLRALTRALQTPFYEAAFLVRADTPASLCDPPPPPPASVTDVTVTQTGETGLLVPGQPRKFWITIRNAGTKLLSNVSLSDSFPNTLQNCQWAIQSASGGPTGQSTGGGAVLTQVLRLPISSTVTYEVTCLVAAGATSAITNTASAPVTGDATPANNSATVIASMPNRGDCNKSGTINASDRDSIHAEIFDGDNSAPEGIGAGTFLGHPVGCNANADNRVDAGDLACLDRILVNQTCGGGVLPSSVPVMSLPNNLMVAGNQTLVSLSLDAAGHELHSLSFSVDYNPGSVTPANNLAAVIGKPGLSPGGTLWVQHVAAAHRIDITLNQPPDQYFRSGVLIQIPFNVTSSASSLHRKIVPLTGSLSVGDRLGRSVPGQFILSQDVFDTLILTDTSRLAETTGLGFEDAGTRDQLMSKLQVLASHPEVNGLVVDLASYSLQLRPLFTAWNPGSTATAEANLPLLGPGGILEIVESLVATFPGVRNLLIVGDDRIIPMARLLDGTKLPESTYTSGSQAQVGNTSTIGRSLEAGYFLSDDLLASANRSAALAVSGSSSRILLPRLLPGRLVENASDIFRSIQLFLDYDGVVDLRSASLSQRQVLVTGYDILTDSAAQVRSAWSSRLNGTSPPPSPQTPVNSLIGASWTKDQLLRALRNTDGLGRSLLASLSGHANHHSLGSPGSSYGLTTTDLYGSACAGYSGSGLDLGGAIVIGMSCHGGLAIPGSCESDSDHSLDLPQVFLASGAIAYGGNSGFGWGTSQGSGLGERLALQIHAQLQRGGEIGSAIRQAKQNYYFDSYRNDAYDRKTLMQWTLFGFPMASISLRTNPSVPFQPTTPSFGEADGEGFRRAQVGGVQLLRRLSTEDPSALAASLPDNLTRAEVRLDFSAAGVYTKYDSSGNLIPVTSACPAAGCFYRLNGLASDESDLPIQPYFSFQSALSNTLPRQALWLGGQYQEEAWKPLFGDLQSVSRIAPADPASLPQQIYLKPHGSSGGEPLPGGPGLGCLTGTLGLSASVGHVSIAAGELRKTSATTWQERTFRTVDFEAFYSRQTPVDCEAPVLDENNDRSSADGGRLVWRIAAADSAGIWRVVVVWDNEEEHRYVPVELTLEGSEWQGSIQVGNRSRIRYYVQAIDREGNVGWMTRTLPLPPSGVPLEVAASRELSIVPINMDLGLTLSPTSQKVRASEIFVIRAEVRNAGPTGTAARVRFGLPTGFSYQYAGGAGWTCSVASREVTCEYAVLGAGSTGSIFLNLQAPPTVDSQPYGLDAEILNDPGSPANNSAHADLLVVDQNVCR